MKSYIGKRSHLEILIQRMRKYSATTRKFADVLSGEKNFVLLGYPEREAAQIYGVNKRAKIVLARKYALHMDNSGHFTGMGAYNLRPNTNFVLLLTPYSPESKLKKILILSLCE